MYMRLENYANIAICLENGTRWAHIDPSWFQWSQVTLESGMWRVKLFQMVFVITPQPF